MKLRSVVSVCALTFALGSVGVVFAQNSDTGFNALPNKEALSKIPDRQKLANAQGMLKSMKTNLKKTTSRFEIAQKKEKDIQKINCINEKLLSTKGFVKVSEQSYVQLKDAVGNKDKSASAHNYSLIVLADDKVSRLTDEAALCVGELAEIDAKGESRYKANPNMAPVEPITPDGRFTKDGIVVIGRIPELTPFQ